MEGGVDGNKEGRREKRVVEKRTKSRPEGTGESRLSPGSVLLPLWTQSCGKSPPHPPAPSATAEAS